MNHSFKSIHRAPVRSIIYILLLSLTATSLCVSIGVWRYSAESIKEVRNTFTSIGVLSELEFTEQMYVKADPPLYEYSMLEKIKERASESVYAIDTDRREYVMGYNQNIKAIAKMGSIYETYPYSLSIVTGICESIEYQAGLNYTAMIRIDYNDLNVLPMYADAYKDIDLMNLTGTYITTDNKAPLKVGEKYIFYVYLLGYDVSEGYFDGRIDKWRYDYYKYEEFVEYDPVTMTEEFGELDEDEIFLKITDASLYMMKELDTTAYEFIEGDNGIWADRVNECMITQHSLEIVFTDCIDSIYMFNKGEAYIVEGRNITDEEFKNGANVCVVSSLFASSNKLKIGDKIKLNVYENDFKIISSTITMSGSSSGVYRSLEGKDKLDIWLAKGFDSEKGFYKEVEYEIVGAYAIDSSTSRNEFNFTYNTMFAPSGSVEGDFNTEPTVLTISRYTDKLEYTDLLRTSVPGSFSVIIENGNIEAFEKEMEEAGYGGIFYYSDQGYSKVSKILDEYNEISMLIAVISICVWMTVVIVFIVMYNSKSRLEIAIMRSLGATKLKTYISELGTIMMIASIALIICVIAGLYVYDTVTDMVFSDISEDSNAVESLKRVIESTRNTIIITAITQFIAIILSFAVTLSTQMKRNVMTLMKKAKKQ